MILTLSIKVCIHCKHLTQLSITACFLLLLKLRHDAHINSFNFRKHFILKANLFFYWLINSSFSSVIIWEPRFLFHMKYLKHFEAMSFHTVPFLCRYDTPSISQSNSLQSFYFNQKGFAPFYPHRTEEDALSIFCQHRLRLYYLSWQEKLVLSRY